MLVSLVYMVSLCRTSSETVTLWYALTSGRCVDTCGAFVRTQLTVSVRQIVLLATMVFIVESLPQFQGQHCPVYALCDAQC